MLRRLHYRRPTSTYRVVWRCAAGSRGNRSSLPATYEGVAWLCCAFFSPIRSTGRQRDDELHQGRYPDSQAIMLSLADRAHVAEMPARRSLVVEGRLPTARTGGVLSSMLYL